jgi:hypothetical protein
MEPLVGVAPIRPKVARLFPNFAPQTVPLAAKLLAPHPHLIALDQQLFALGVAKLISKVSRPILKLPRLFARHTGLFTGFERPVSRLGPPLRETFAGARDKQQQAEDQ